MKIQGTIKRIDRLPPAADGVPILGALSIGSTEQGSPDAEVTITRATRVLRAGALAASFEGLRVGERVMVLFAGAAQETYPIRGVAAEVSVLEAEQ